MFQGTCAQPEITILHLDGQKGDNEGQGSLLQFMGSQRVDMS